MLGTYGEKSIIEQKAKPLKMIAAHAKKIKIPGVVLTIVFRCADNRDDILNLAMNRKKRNG